ncbi:MAG: rhamnogalacturonan acetylesterase, partial [Actinomycetota bacterium]
MKIKFLLFAIILCATLAANAQTSLKFTFGSGKDVKDFTQVQASDFYSKEKGYGFEPGTDVKCSDKGGRTVSGFCTSDKPFYFSAAVPEGNYKVTITFGDKNEVTVTTVKAELRRLMLENVETAKGK